MLNGKNVFFGRESDSPVSNRLYIIKISQFNAVPGMHAALRDIDKRLRVLGLHREQLVYIDRARGIEPSSVIGFLFYDNPSQQSVLYADKALMGLIAAFNKKYVRGFVYLQGRVVAQDFSAGLGNMK